MGFVAGALFFCFVFFPRRDAYGMGVQKKMKTGLRTTKFSLNCSLRGWHYPKHLKNIAQLTKIKRSPIKANFQDALFFRSCAQSRQSAINNQPYLFFCLLPFAHCQLIRSHKNNSSYTLPVNQHVTGHLYTIKSFSFGLISNNHYL